MTKAKAQKSKSRKIPVHSGPFRVAACWPHQQAPLILSMLGDDQVMIATSFTPIAVDSLFDQPFANFNDKTCAPEIASILPRWIVALPYDTFAGGATGGTSERPIAWNIKAALVWNRGSTEPRYISRDDAKTSRFHFSHEKDLKALLAEAKSWTPPQMEAIDLLPTTSDETYVESVRDIIESIKSGDFYQVNLLRYFQAPQARGWENLCRRMEEHSGPHGAILTQGSRVIASMSPERFVAISRQNHQLVIDTWPIKGTAPRVRNNDHEDSAAGEALLKSSKDQAELHMIIDLMRNDLNRVCTPASVEVVSSGTLKKFEHVWHLEGHVRGVLKQDLTFKDLLSALCPGGSITGAPKIAAMERIHRDEGQERGFFMGNIFQINHDGSMHSNILIRTIVSDNFMRSARYAAGSGIVIKSIPENELAEIRAKCATLTSLDKHMV